MGIVNEHRIGGGDRNHLHTAPHPLGAPEGGGNLRQRQPQAKPAGDGGQSVVDGEAPGYGQVDPLNLLPAHRLKLHMAGKQPDIFGREAGRVLVLRVGERGALHPLPIPPARRVVQVQHRPPALPEQKALGLAVCLHAPVVVQVVLGQVGEHPRVELQPLHPVLDQGVGGHLHHHMGAAPIRHTAQQALKLIALRRGAPRREDLVPHHVLDGSDQPHPGPQHRFQHILDEKGGGGLPVGPGYPHQGQPLRRPAEPVGRQKGQGPPGIRGHQPGPILLRAFPAEDGGRPPVQGLPDVPGPVIPGPGKGREQGPGLYGPCVIGYGIYFHIKIRSLPREGDAAQKFPQLHIHHPSRVSFILSKPCCAGG